MKRIISLLVSILMMSMVLLGCASAEAAIGPATIQFCVNIQPQLPLEFWQSIADRFMAQYPDVTVEVIGQPSSNVDIYQYEKTLLATGQFPDVLVMQNPADFVPSGALMAFEEGELDYLVDPNVGKIEGKQYVANYKKQIIGVFYNKTMFEANGLQVPQTYQEFINICETLKAQEILPVSIGIKDGWPQVMLANMLAGTDLLAKNPDWGAERNADSVKFNNPDLVKAMEKYQTITQNYCGTSLPSITYTQMLEQFFTGRAAMLPMGSWINAEVAKAEQDFEVGWFPMPGDNDASVLSVFVNEGLSISAFTEYPEACKAFVKFFFTDKELYGDFLASEQLFGTTIEPVEYEMIPLRKQMEEMIAGMTEVEGFESMTGDAAFLPGLKDYYTNRLTQNIAIGRDVAAELDSFDKEWETAMEALQ